MVAAQVRLYGKVTDEKGQPMDMVHVRLSRGSVGTLTNFKGEYELQVGDSDSLRVIFSSLGYMRQEKVVNTRRVKPNDQGFRRMMLNAQMRPNQSVLNDVEVTAQRQAQPGPMAFEAQRLVVAQRHYFLEYFVHYFDCFVDLHQLSK